jgi:hypothetical protein
MLVIPQRARRQLYRPKPKHPKGMSFRSHKRTIIFLCRPALRVTLSVDGEKAFFFEKKKQKTFGCLGRGLAG